MAKYKPKTGTKRNTPWTVEDREYLRRLSQQGVSTYHMAELLDRTNGAISQQIFLMRKQDAAEGYVEVAEGNTLIDAEHSRMMRDQAQMEQDAKLRAFRLFEARYARFLSEPKPTLWQRIRSFLHI